MLGRSCPTRRHLIVRGRVNVRLYFLDRLPNRLRHVVLVVALRMHLILKLIRLLQVSRMVRVCADTSILLMHLVVQIHLIGSL